VASARTKTKRRPAPSVRGVDKEPKLVALQGIILKTRL
jgi:hypothetical protein